MDKVAMRYEEQGPLGWDIRDLGETPQEALGRIRAERPHAALANGLEDAGVRDPDALARFLGGPGCPGCLAQWWGVEDAEVDQPQEPAAPLAWRRHVLRPSSDPLHIEFEMRNAASSPSAAMWARLRELADRDDGARGAAEDPGAICLGLVAAGEDEPERLLAEVDQVRRAVRDGARPEADHLQRAARQLTVGGKTLARPLLVDHRPRSRQALLRRTPDAGLFDEALMAGRSSVREAAGLLLATPRFHLAVLLGLAAIAATLVLYARLKGAEIDWWDVPEALRVMAMGDAPSLLWRDWLGLVALPAVLCAGAVRAVSAFLPQVLRPRWDTWMGRRLGLGSTDAGKAEEAPEWLRGELSPHDRWLRRRIFGGDIAVAILGDVEEWTAADAAALRRLSKLRPESRSLLVIVHMTSEAAIDRALLWPFLREPQKDSHRFDSVEFVTGPCPKPLVVEAAPAPTGMWDPADPLAFLRSAVASPQAMSAEEIVGLLGLEAAEGHAFEDVEASIRDDVWTLADLIPMLCLGSTHEAPFSVMRLTSTGLEDRAKPLSDDLAPFARSFVGDETIDLNVAAHGDHFAQLAARLQETTAVREASTGTRGGRVTAEVIGRARRREAMADAVRSLFGDDAARAETYLRHMLGCGELHALMSLRGLAERSPIDAADLGHAVRLLRSARWLRAEIREGERGRDRDSLIARARHAAATALASAEIADDGEETSRLAARLHVLAEAAFADEIPPEGWPHGALRQAWETASADALCGFGSLDRDLAMDRAEAILAPILVDLAPDERTPRLASAKTAWERGKPLSERLAGAADVQDLHRIVERHRDAGPVVPATLACCLSLSAQSGGARRRLGERLDAWRRDLPAMPRNVKTAGVPRPIHFIGADEAMLLASIPAAELIKPTFRPQRHAAPLSDIGEMLAAFEPLDRRVERRRWIRWSRPSGNTE